MRTRTELTILALFLGLALVLVLSLDSRAEVAGRFTQAEGRVDLLKGGKLPATPVKVDNQVEVGDVVRTKSLSRAQITFIDNTTLTISPESRIAVEDYMFDPAKQKRHAVLEIFQGMALTVVTKIFKVKEPDFIVKTNTAIMGVRGTKTGFRLHPNASTFLNFAGECSVKNKFPEIKGEVLLKNMEGTTVGRNLPPTLPSEISSQDHDLFIRQLTACVPSASKLCSVPEPGRIGAGAPTGPMTTPVATSLNNPGEQTILTTLNTVTVPPTVTPAVQTNPTYTFAQVFSGPYQLTSVAPYTVGNFATTGPAYGTRTGVYPGTFTATYNFTATWVSPTATWSPSYQGTFLGTMRGQVQGVQGQVLTGNMSMVLTDPSAGRFNVSGAVTIAPSGVLTASFAGTGVTLPGLEGINATNGAISQTPITGAGAAAPIIKSKPMADH
jgi:hypothetical protein